MKQSNFTMNSDFLTIAQSGSMSPYTVYYPSRQFPTSGTNLLEFHVDYDITYPATQGSVERFCIEYNGKKIFGNMIYRNPDVTESGGNIITDQWWVLTVYRKDANTITARCDFIPPSQSATIPSTPTLTFTISSVSFRPPNVF